MSDISEDSWSMASTGSHSFSRAKLDMQQAPTDGDIQTLPQLAEYNATHNLDYLFCLQALKTSGDLQGAPEDKFIRITHRDFKFAVVRCQRWLSTNVKALKKPERNADGNIVKGPPAAVLMESDVGLFIYMMALIGLGIPVLLLSARLSPTAIQSLLEKTGASCIVTSSRLQSTANNAIALAPSDAIKPQLYLRLDFQEFLQDVNDSSDLSEATICSPNHYINEKDRKVLILHSSGTTGLPKPIYTSHKYLLGYAACHELDEEEAQNINCSTLPLYHGFGLLAPGLSMSIGLTVCFPPSSIIPNGHAAVELVHRSNAKSLMTVPSILEDIASLSDDQIKTALSTLQFVVWGGGPLKPAVGERLAAVGVKLLNHSGATEVGALGSIFVPGPDYDWQYIRFRRDFKLQFQEAETSPGEVQRYKMVARPFGWDGTFELQDQLITNPKKPLIEFHILGRNDDLIVLATGEKVLPQILESLLSDHADVKAAVAFGEGQFELGVIVEPLRDVEDDLAFKSAIWPMIIEADMKMDGHAQISSPNSVIVVPPGACPRSDKGSIMRKETYRVFEKEIAKVYRRLENNIEDGRVIFATSPSLEQEIKDLILSTLDWKTVSQDWAPDSDFFEMGMDSLQALRVRRALLPSLVKGSSGARTVENIGREFLYQHPTIADIANFMRSTRNSAVGSPSKQAIIDGLVESHFSELSDMPHGTTILLTGSTGSLGSHLVAHLAKLPQVRKVICLARPRADASSPKSTYDRQIQALNSKGLFLTEESLTKVEVIETNTAIRFLGLKEDEYEELCKSVTHILHNAWPVDFKRHLSSFEGQFHTIRHLVHLARKIHAGCPPLRPTLLFVSSIATVGQYGRVHGPLIVPEVPIEDVNSTNPFGYAEAKLVCEKVLDRVSESFGNELEVRYVRVGQMAGSKITGFWNSSEHLPALVKSSQKVGALPKIRGTLSWLPVDDAAISLSEILLAGPSPNRVFHLENPVRQSWSDALDTLATELEISTTIPLSDWVRRVAKVPDEAGAENPAKQLLRFFEQDFEHNATGKVIMDTARSRDISPTLSAMQAVSEQTMKMYVHFWKSSGFLSS